MVAKLRTLTGCLQCRRRRKKCDENKPTCIGCRRNGLICQWPGADRTDRRRLRHRKTAQIIQYRPTTQLELARKNAPELLDSISIFHHVIDQRSPLLVEYSLFCFLPSQYHQAADGKPTIDLSYLCYMCLESRLLLDAVSACALVALHGTSTDASHESSHKLYMNAVSEISTGISNGTLTGKEDSLLAAVIWLCVYENSRVEGRRQSAIHAAALRRILLLREPMDYNHASLSELIWERMCVESYIYHSAVTTLFDDHENLIEDTLMVLKKFQGRVSSTPWEEANEVYASNELHVKNIMHQLVVQSPVLGAPYHMFLFLMEGVRLARTAYPESVIDEISVWSRYYEVYRMQADLEETAYSYYGDSRRWIGKLYAVAIRLLFLYVIATLNHDSNVNSGISTPWYTELDYTLSEARSLLITTEDDIDRTWGKFFLWPLAVIGAIIYESHDIFLVRSWLDRVTRKSNSSSVLIIKKVLEERIWNVGNGGSASDNSLKDYTGGLSIMLNTDIMNDAAACLKTFS